MKKIYILFFLSVSLFFIQKKSYAQTLINRDWAEVTGYPKIDFDFQTSTKDADGNIIVIGNTFRINEEENFLITKYSTDGVKVWEYEFNGWTDLTDFGTCVVTDVNDIYVSGVSYDTTINGSSFEVLKLDKNGSLLWHDRYSYSSSELRNIPLAMCIDNKGSVYVTGTCQTDVNDYAIVTLKYDGSGNQIWHHEYDSLGLVDGAGGIKFLENGGSPRIVVYGVSGSTTSSWDFVSIIINATTGAGLDRTRINNPNAYFAKPTDIVKDDFNNIYATGTVQTGLNNTDIKVIKMDTFMNVIWVQTFDGGAMKNDEATAMKLDSKGNILITGYASRSNNAKELWLMKLNNAGTKLWDRRRYNPKGAGAEGKEVETDANGNVYTVGKLHSGVDYDYLTQCYDSIGNLKWEKIYATDSTSDDEAQDVTIDKYNDIVVSGRNKVSGGLWRYTTVKYEPWEKPKDFVPDNNGNPHFMNNQLIVKFRKDMVNTSFTDNPNLQYTSMQEALKPWAFDTLQKRFSFLFNNGTRVEKIYKTLKSTYSYSIARNGDSIKVPDFWASFLVFVPDPSSRNFIDVKDTLNHLFPLIEYANLNYLATLQSKCDPFDSSSTNTWNDPALRNGWQKGLTDLQAGIAADSAWCYEVGKSFVKVGIYDDGLDMYHEDFGGIRQSGQPVSYDTSKIAGWDLVNNIPLSTPFYPEGYHGTGIAGVIGAVRNNSLGIAGIAGGDDRNSNKGVSLFGIKVSEYIAANSTTYISTANLANSYIVGSSDIPSANFGYGLHLSTHSYGFLAGADTITSTNLNPNELLELSRAVHYCNRNQMVFFSSAGNDRYAVYYPSNLYHDWIICTSTSNGIGNRQVKGTTGSDPDWSPFEGRSIDLVAPGVRASTYSTVASGSFGNQYSNNNYFYQTSFSNAYSAGVGALLKSYLDTTVSSSKNLSPDDLEFILTKTAIDIDLPGKDTLSGWGRINANRALKYVDKNCRKLTHFRTKMDTLHGISTVSTFAGYLNANPVPIRLTERLQLLNGAVIDSGISFVRYGKFAYECTFPLPINHKLKDVWTRNSSSNLYGLFDTVTQVLEPYEKINLTLIGSNKVKVEGHFYEFTDTLSNNLIGVLGGTDLTGVNFNTQILDFTVLSEDTVHKCDSVVFTQIDKLTDDVSCILYPNPTTDNTSIQLMSTKREDVSLTLTDISGKAIYDKSFQVYGTYNQNISLDHLAPCIYVLKIGIDNHSKSFKIIKL